MSDTDTLLRLLASEDRRRVLLLLRETDSIRVPEALRTRSASRLRGDGRDERRGDGRERELPELMLVNQHLPKLDAEGLVEWLPAERTASRGPEFDDVAPVLDLLVANRDALPNDFLTL